MGHTVGDAAANAVKKSERKVAAEMTPAELISALRKNYKANLYIPMHQIGALLAAFDNEHELASASVKALEEAAAEKKVMTDTILGLTQKVQEFQNAVAKAESDLQAAV